MSCQRLGRAGWYDPVAARQHDKRRPTHQPRIDGLSANPPLQSAGQVLAIPRARALMRHAAAQRHPIIEPVFERDEAAGLAAIRSERRKAREFALGSEWIEHEEEALYHVDRDHIVLTARA